MREQVGGVPLERTQPVPDRFSMAPEPFVLAARPAHDEGINRAEFRREASRDRTGRSNVPIRSGRVLPSGYILQLQVVAPMQSPASHASAHPLGGLTADRRQKTYEAFAVAVLRRPRPKRIAKKVERARRISPRRFASLQ